MKGLVSEDDADMMVAMSGIAVLAMIALRGRNIGVEVRLVYRSAGLRSSCRFGWHVGVDIHDD